jgi:hypothetical protein
LLFDKLINFSTNNSVLNLLNNLVDSKASTLIRACLDYPLAKLETRLFGKNSQSKHVFLGSIISQKYNSALGGFYWELMKKYVLDWKNRQNNRILIQPPKRIIKPLKRTYIGWKQLREEIQRIGKSFPNNRNRACKDF